MEEYKELENCNLLSSNGIFYQVLLLIFTAIILILRRFSENPKRAILIYLLDNLKILTGYFLIHMLNLFFSINFSNSSEPDQCIWYFSSYFIDCSLGLLLNYYFLKIFEKLDKDLITGNYFNIWSENININYKIWSYQLIIWLVIIILMKFIVISIQIVFSIEIYNMCKFIFNILNIKGNFKLLFSVIIFPNIINIFQFIIQDIIIKKKKFWKTNKDIYKQYFIFLDE